MAPVPNAVKIGGAVALVAIVLGGLVFLLTRTDGDSDGSPGATLTPAASLTAVATETATPGGTGSLSPQEQAEAFALQPVEGLVELLRPGADEALESETGVYFMDVTSGVVEGWRALVGETTPQAISGDHRYTTFNRRQSTIMGGVTYPAGDYLADRETRVVYRWEGDAEVVLSERSSSQQRLATAGDRVLFRIEDPGGDDWFVVVELNPDPEVVSIFGAKGFIALFADDGSRLAIAGATLSLVDVESGTVERFENPIPAEIDLEGSLALRTTGEGEAFLLTIGPVKPGYEGAWLRYDWQGSVRQSRQGAFSVYPSGNGEFVATVESLLDGDETWPELTVFTATSTSDGADMFRVVGALESFGYTTGDIWLADGSGIVLSNASLELLVAINDGSFRPYIGMPSPIDPALFATSSPVDDGPQVLDDDGNVIVRANAFAQSFRSPWGADGSEIHFVVPHGGHGGIGNVRSLVVPRVDQPPYSGVAGVSLANEALGWELVDAPGGSAVVGTLDTSVVTVLEMQRIRLGSTEPGYERYCGLLKDLAPETPADCDNFPLWGQWALIGSQGNPLDEAGWLLIAVGPEGL